MPRKLWEHENISLSLSSARTKRQALRNLRAHYRALLRQLIADDGERVSHGVAQYRIVPVAVAVKLVRKHPRRAP